MITISYEVALSWADKLAITYIKRAAFQYSVNTTRAKKLIQAYLYVAMYWACLHEEQS